MGKQYYCFFKERPAKIPPVAADSGGDQGCGANAPSLPTDTVAFGKMAGYGGPRRFRPTQNRTRFRSAVKPGRLLRHRTGRGGNTARRAAPRKREPARVDCRARPRGEVQALRNELRQGRKTHPNAAGPPVVPVRCLLPTNLLIKHPAHWPAHRAEAARRTAGCDRTPNTFDYLWPPANQQNTAQLR